MIQRIQSLYLLLAGVLSMLIYYLPLGNLQADEIYHYHTCYLSLGTEVIMLAYGNAIVNALGGLLVFVIIFLYKKRNLQIRLCGLAILLFTILLAAMFFYAESYAGKLNGKMDYNYLILTPVLVIGLIYLALRATKKDEMLVRAASRLR